MPVKVAQARLKAECPFLQNEEVMSFNLGKSIGDPKLERHVEARNFQDARERDSAQVMDRGAATRDETEDPLKPITASTWDL